MSSTLLDTLSGLMTPDLVGRAASALGESEPAVSKGMSAVFPVLLSSVANPAEVADFASTLFNLVRDPANDGSLLGNVAGLPGPGASSSPMMALSGKLLSSLFGNNLGSLASSRESVAGPAVAPRRLFRLAGACGLRGTAVGRGKEVHLALAAAAADRARGAVAAVALHGPEGDRHAERRDRARSGGRVRPGARADACAGSRGGAGRGDPARELLLRS